jgi:hypothetical protein
MLPFDRRIVLSPCLMHVLLLIERFAFVLLMLCCLIWNVASFITGCLDMKES